MRFQPVSGMKDRTGLKQGRSQLLGKRSTQAPLKQAGKTRHAAAVCRFNKVKFSVQAVHTPASQASSAQSAQSAEAVRQVEAKLLQKKSELRQFESQYRQVSSPDVAVLMVGLTS